MAETPHYAVTEDLSANSRFIGHSPQDAQCREKATRPWKLHAGKVGLGFLAHDLGALWLGLRAVYKAVQGRSEDMPQAASASD